MDQIQTIDQQLPSTLPGLVEAFKESFSRWAEETLRLSRLYAEALKRHTDAKQKFHEAFPSIPSKMWAQFEAVGNGWMHPKLLTMEHPAAMKIQRMPYSDQVAAIEGKIDVLTKEGDTIRVSATEMPPNLVSQVFDKDHIRSLSEQKIWLESQIGGKFRPVAQAYRIVGGNKVHVKADTELSKSDLLRILAEMK